MLGNQIRSIWIQYNSAVKSSPTHTHWVSESYNSVEGHRSNPVLAVKCSLFVEICFLRPIFF